MSPRGLTYPAACIPSLPLAGHEYNTSGIFATNPRDAPGPVIFRESIVVGETTLSQAEVQQAVYALGETFKGNSYHLLERNCNHFSEALTMRLTNHRTPGWVNRLAYVAVMVHCLLPTSLVPPLTVKEPSSKKLPQSPPPQALPLCPLQLLKLWRQQQQLGSFLLLLSYLLFRWIYVLFSLSLSLSLSLSIPRVDFLGPQAFVFLLRAFLCALVVAQAPKHRHSRGGTGGSRTERVSCRRPWCRRTLAAWWSRRRFRR